MAGKRGEEGEILADHLLPAGAIAQLREASGCACGGGVGGLVGRTVEVDLAFDNGNAGGVGAAPGQAVEQVAVNAQRQGVGLVVRGDGAARLVVEGLVIQVGIEERFFSRARISA